MPDQGQNENVSVPRRNTDPVAEELVQLLLGKLTGVQYFKNNACQFIFKTEMDGTRFNTLMRMVLNEDLRPQANSLYQYLNAHQYKKLQRWYPTARPDSYIVKTVRGDNKNYWRNFIQMITYSPVNKIKFPVRPKTKKPITVDARGIYSRSIKEPMYSPDEKDLFSQLQSVTLVTKNVLPPLFGHVRKAEILKLVGVKMARTHALFGRMKVYDAGSVSRPWDHTDLDAASKYLNSQDGKLYADEALFEQAIEESINEGKYNEVLARLKWGEGDEIIIGTDNLESRLLAQDYARTLLARLKEQTKEHGLAWDEKYQINIRYYLPNTIKHLQIYDQETQQKDILEAKKILQDTKILKEKCEHHNYECLLALDKAEVLKTLSLKLFNSQQPLIFRMIQAGYLHILQSLLEIHGDFLDELKIEKESIDSKSMALLQEAAFANHAHALQWLIKLGFGANAAKADKHPLLSALERGGIKSALKILNWEADKTKQNSEIQIANQNRWIKQGLVRVLDTSEIRRSFFLAAKGGHLEVVNTMLQQFKVNPVEEWRDDEYEKKENRKNKNKKYKNRNALYSAAKAGHIEIIKLLKPYIQSPKDDSVVQGAILIAAQNGHLSVLKEFQQFVNTKKIFEAAKRYHHFPIMDWLLSVDSTIPYNALKDFEKTVAEGVMASYENRDRTAAYHLKNILESAQRYDIQLKFFKLSCEMNLFDTVKLLYSTTHDRNKLLMLMLIAKKGHRELFREMLLQHENIKPEEIAALLKEDKTNLLDGECIRFLLSKGAAIDSVDGSGNTFLFNAIRLQDVALCNELINASADVNARNAQPQTPLIWAVRYGNTKIAAMLLAKKANINIKLGYEQNLLFEARHYEMVEFLLNQGLTLEHKNLYNQTMFQNPTKNNETLLFEAVRNNDIDLIQWLIKVGADVNHKNLQGETPLFHAVRVGNLEVMKVLIDAGALLTIKNANGETPLLQAILQRDLEAANLLLTSGAKFMLRKTTTGLISGMGILHKKGYEQFALAFMEMTVKKYPEIIDEYLESFQTFQFHEADEFFYLLVKANVLDDVSVKSQMIVFSDDRIHPNVWASLFSRLINKYWNDKALTLAEKAKLIVDRKIYFNQLKQLSPLQKAGLLIDIAYDSNLPCHKAFMDLILDERQGKDIVDIALEDMDAAVLLLNCHFGVKLNNQDRVKIILKWTQGSVEMQRSFLAALNQVIPAADLYGQTDNALRYTLSNMGLFSSDRLKLQSLADANKIYIKSFQPFFESLENFCKSEHFDSQLAALHQINQAYQAQKPKVEIGFDAAQALKLHELGFLTALANLAADIKSDKELNRMLHHKMYLKHTLSEINEILSKEISNANDPASINKNSPG